MPDFVAIPTTISCSIQTCGSVQTAHIVQILQDVRIPIVISVPFFIKTYRKLSKLMVTN